GADCRARWSAKARTAAPCRSSMASFRVRISSSPCPSGSRAGIAPQGANPTRMPMPPERTPPACLAVTQDSPGASRGTAAGGALVALIACGCAIGAQRAPPPAPVVNAAVASSTALNEYLLLLQHLVQGKPPEQV